MSVKYVFIGSGDGVPGLPREVTEAEAEALGAAELLAEAIQAGAYVPSPDPSPPAPLPLRAHVPSEEGGTPSPQPSPLGRGSKSKKE
jgi:hypothetical protein